ncbi:hypothetical protein [Leptospira borgpetersenii]|uniref:hypothetical protein n=1 Tax=Leptospira borgpetersenii TaxID=174 RepID=UPI00077303C9|nr:hypothetical protein [Leptospira borgpetersenii]MBE8401009.1 hypothetical protein [Leptospira borgpetersenii serovar Tarassovi]MBE8403092.1 hypothetical protein [Leptospira borgpetersenii serovar Tarassovi]MBE8406094.1 hypothetical protein [Leptospira borgpetersenii serovar Tarassovi]MBE8414029.1 hypothetical protein [Leptospira borgpetersenii serovar Tarassovi]MBE8414376.1 hypothetical protein [Leptospira borgpetersenii serovar Tarassovi]
MEANQRKEGYAIGEAVRNKTTGRRMYVEIAWSPEVRCVYFDAEKGNLVKIRMYPEELERIQGVLPYLPK